MNYRTFLVVIVILTLAACSSSTTVNGQGGSLIQPKAGSTFIYHEIVWDTLGRTVEDYYDTEVVIQSGIAFAGKPNVNVLETNGDTLHPFYRSYETNGDLAYYIDIPNTQPGWPTWPIGSKLPTEYLQIDTT